MKQAPRIAVTLSLLLAAVGASVGEARADHAGDGVVHPGMQLYTPSGQCTANFVYTDGASQYIGLAAHCFGTGGQTETNGCEAPTLGHGAPVRDVERNQVGTLAYSSWVVMQAVDENDADTCAHNDFALVRIDGGRTVDPSVPHWGGPVGVAPDGTEPLEQVYAYGNSILRLGLTVLSPKTGLSYGTDAGGWNHPVVTAPAPDVPGDSGSGLLDADGNALGVLSHLSVSIGIPTGTGVTNNYSDVRLALEYMRANGGPSARLVPGAAFDGGQLPLGL